MKNKIIPTIFALDEETFEKKLKILEFCDEIHLDFMDGKFTSRATVSISAMKSILKYPNKRFQIHLMAENPIKYINEIKLLGIKTVSIQEEVFDSVDDLEKGIRQFKDLDFEVFVVLNPDTDFSRVKNFFEIIDGIMIMSVVPGAEGQSFIEATYDKVSELNGLVEDSFPIQIDGGVNDINCQRLKESGANNLCVGSFISSSKNPLANYQKLLNVIN